MQQQGMEIFAIARRYSEIYALNQLRAVIHLIYLRVVDIR